MQVRARTIHSYKYYYTYNYLLSSYVQDAVSDKLNPPSNLRQTFQVHNVNSHYQVNPHLMAWLAVF